MQRKILVLLSFSLFLGSNILFGQTTSSNTTEIIKENSTLLNLNSDDWSFFVDEENQIYYIDFETIDVNLSDIIVKNDIGDVIIKEDVMDLPVNTIFEIDFSQYGKGNYAIELRSFKGTFEKEVLIK